MYTHLIIERGAAQHLWNECKLGEQLARERRFEPFDEFFLRGETHIRELGCQFRLFSPGERPRYSLQFNKYLPEVPKLLKEMTIPVLGAEIKRYNSAPTKARAGYYVWEGKNATATVERIFPEQYGQNPARKVPVAPLYAQNIFVQGPSLPVVIEFNSKLSMGHFNRFRVDTWE